jgi:hypothetical protein
MKLPEITEHQIWTPLECGQIAMMVRALRPYWIDRGRFYTLGAATYQDPAHSYPGLANCTNILLAEKFYNTNEFEILQKKMAAIYGARVMALEDFAYPGFHVFDHQANGQVGSLHFDEPYRHLRLPEGWSNPTSFTIPIQMPELGAGLNYWSEDTIPLDREYTGAEKIPEPDDHLQYELGVMYKHGGKFYHQISNNNPLSDTDYRITLQGHTVTLPDGEILAYF